MRRLAPALESLLLLMLGSTLILGLAVALGPSDSDATLYYRVVVLKGLLPQLGLTLALLPALRRFRVRRATPAHAREAAAPGPASRLLECTVMSSLAYCAVAPFLLSVNLPGWPALRMVEPAQKIGNFLLMTAVVALLAWWPLWRRHTKSAHSSDREGDA
ncbi:MAG: hypothetical protein VCC04_14610 [Myxococcota bacterium]